MLKATTPGIKNKTTSPVTSANGGTGAASNPGTVASYDMCLKDDTNGDFIQWSSTTGDYLFTHCGPNPFTMSGVGTTSLMSGTQMLRDNKVDRNITAGFLTGQLTGRATIVVISSGSGTHVFTVSQTKPHATCASQYFLLPA